MDTLPSYLEVLLAVAAKSRLNWPSRSGTRLQPIAMNRYQEGKSARKFQGRSLAAWLFLPFPKPKSSMSDPADIISKCIAPIDLMDCLFLDRTFFRVEKMGELAD